MSIVQEFRDLLDTDACDEHSIRLFIKSKGFELQHAKTTEQIKVVARMLVYQATEVLNAGCLAQVVEQLVAQVLKDLPSTAEAGGAQASLSGDDSDPEETDFASVQASAGAKGKQLPDEDYKRLTIAFTEF